MKKLLLLSLVLLSAQAFPCSMDIEALNKKMIKDATSLFKVPASIKMIIVDDIDAVEAPGDFAYIQSVLWDETYAGNSTPGASCADEIVEFSRVKIRILDKSICNGIMKSYPISSKKSVLVFKKCHRDLD